jgi:hypothetical protein
MPKQTRIESLIHHRNRHQGRSADGDGGNFGNASSALMLI